jgi:hypothetical protein
VTPRGVAISPSLPRSLPLQRIPAARSHLPPARPNSPVTLRPQGFSPSRRLAPLTTSRACSIPVPLMGFDPPRPLSSPDAVRPLERRAPLGFLLHSIEEAAPPGTTHTRRSPPPGLGFSQDPHDACLPGLSRSEVSCSRQWSTLTRTLIPSRASSARPHADRTAGAPGFFAASNAAALSRDRQTSMQFPTSLCSSRRFGFPAELGLWVPLRDRPASPLAGTSSSPCCQVPGRSLSRSLCR